MLLFDSNKAIMSMHTEARLPTEMITWCYPALITRMAKPQSILVVSSKTQQIMTMVSC